MTTGSNLRILREKLGFTMREVEAASEKLARKHGNEGYLVPASQLYECETKGAVPSIHRLYSLAIIYRRDFHELLSWYGVELNRGVYETVDMPAQMHPSFEPRKTVKLSRMVEAWGTVPLMYLERLSKVNYTYGYIGSEDLTMYPILLPGSFIQIDESRNKVSKGVGRSIYERPIYFVETRNGHVCCWCTRKGEEIILEPHPLSPFHPRVFKHPQEAEVIGQVVGVAMKLATFLQSETEV